MTEARCSATKKNGEPCGMQPPEGATLCLNHDPSRAEQMRQARGKGGAKANTEGPKITHLRAVTDVSSLLPVLVEELRIARDMPVGKPRSDAVASVFTNILGALRLARDLKQDATVKAVLQLYEDAQRMVRDGVLSPVPLALMKEAK